jgi:hypothetical protein
MGDSTLQRKRWTRHPIPLTLAVGLATLFALVATVAVARQDEGISRSALTCPLEPLTLPLFAATPAATIGTPAPIDTQAPADEPSAEVRDEIGESVEVIIACANTGEPRFTFAVFTDRYLASLFTGDEAAYQPAFERQLTQPATPPSSPLVLQELRSVRLLPDGRAIVELVIAGDTTLTDTLVLVQDGEYWLVDDVLELSPPA